MPSWRAPGRSSRAIRPDARRSGCPRAARRGGLRPEPLACTLTRGGTLPLDIPLFAEPEARVIVFSGADIDTSGARRRLMSSGSAPRATFATALLTRCGRIHGVRTLLCEGGPGPLRRARRAKRPLDQLFLTLSSTFVRRR